MVYLHRQSDPSNPPVMFFPDPVSGEVPDAVLDLVVQQSGVSSGDAYATTTDPRLRSSVASSYLTTGPPKSETEEYGHI